MFAVAWSGLLVVPIVAAGFAAAVLVDRIGRRWGR